MNNTLTVSKATVFKLLPSETVLPDDYDIHPMYVYIIDGVFARFEGMESDTVGNWKRYAKINEIRRCDLFSHPGARLGDKVE